MDEGPRLRAQQGTFFKRAHAPLPPSKKTNKKKLNGTKTWKGQERRSEVRSLNIWLAGLTRHLSFSWLLSGWLPFSFWLTPPPPICLFSDSPICFTPPMQISFWWIQLYHSALRWFCRIKYMTSVLITMNMSKMSICNKAESFRFIWFI